MTTHFVYDDGGRAAAGFKGQAGDCVTRAIAIATGIPYREVYDALNAATKSHRRLGGASGARNGIPKATTREYLARLGWRWTPTMKIGSGCKVHLRPEELPKLPRLIAKVSGHIVAVVDGVIRDTYDPTRDGTRCVYGYWYPPDGWIPPGTHPRTWPAGTRVFLYASRAYRETFPVILPPNGTRGTVAVGGREVVDGREVTWVPCGVLGEVYVLFSGHDLPIRIYGGELKREDLT